AAAQLFVDLAQPQDAVGLVVFSDRGVPLVPLRTLVNPTTRTLLHTHLRTLKFTGQTTDLAAALEAGLAGLPPDPDKTHCDLVLLLTDGQLDLGQRRRSEEPALLAHIRHVILPQYRQRGIGLHTIAFTAEADQVFLQEIAQATGGEFRFINDAAILHKAFSQLFILAHQAESFPLDHEHFTIDKSVQDVSLVFAKREPRERIGLVTPQHGVAHADNVPPGMTWNSTPAYDRVQITQPEPGTWQIERPAGVQEGVAIVASSTLSLQVELSPAYQEAGKAISIRAFLQEKGQPVREAEQVQQMTMRAEVTTPQRGTLPIMLTSESAGVFVATLPLLQVAGQYGLVVTAASPTLQRQRTLSFTLHPPLPVTVPTPSPLSAAPAASWHDAAGGAVRKLLVLNILLGLVGGMGYGLYRYHAHHKKVSDARNTDMGSHALGGGIPPQ
ncbi:MAG TPA: VWA domain-containing protein, partial [Candidatus Saccharimonadia bacterium]|nr:VWA domain-containing protein [Candidatus Saccharimonadia bacterium]